MPRSCTPWSPRTAPPSDCPSPGTCNPSWPRRAGQSACLICYTDGLVERRGEVIDVGIQRLCAAVEPGPAESVCARIMTTLAAEQTTDDIALLAIHSTRRDQP
ncbi:SpoIIE family protein phosphatase [Micromonospora sp. NPDC020750]|uniref:SpoIIE family protein phosphatase n=1 Tax=unclassified Micromonospora TaxID=2617518 RepID=UPI0037B9285A